MIRHQLESSNDLLRLLVGLFNYLDRQSRDSVYQASLESLLEADETSDALDSKLMIHLYLHV